MERKKTKVLVVVNGGVIQSIYSTDPDLKFDILDYDNEEPKNKEKELEVLESKTIDLVAIY